MAAVGTCRREVGAALLAVLVILLVVGGSSASFIWFMNQQQTRAGTHYRAMAAMAAAEAGVHRALSILESVAPDQSSPGRTWRPGAYSEAFTAGPLEARFTLSLTDDDTDGAVIVTSTGHASGVTRRLRARVYLASPSLLAALNGASVVRVDQPPAATFILPYEAGTGDRPWIHIAAGREISFATTGVSINDPSGTFVADPGPLDSLGGTLEIAGSRVGPVRLLLARDAELTLGDSHERVDVQQLRTMGVYLDGRVLRADTLPGLPEVNRAFYQTQAVHNLKNANLNNAAGKYLGDRDFASKQDSLYSRSDFEKVQAYLQTRSTPTALQGVIYVQDGVTVTGGSRLQIVDGALITDGSVHVGLSASLEITHSQATRTLPGIVALDTGTLVVSQGARLRVHGLVYINRVINIEEGARVDVVGAVLSNDPGLSFRNHATTVVIRYDPAVLGTPGLRVSDGASVVAWVASWEELP